MLKSKYSTLLIISVFIVLGILFAVKIGYEKTLNPETYSDKEYPLSFSYNTGIDTYAFSDRKYFELAKKSEPDLLRMLTLVEESENQKLVEDIKNGVAREGPPGITVFIINNKENLTTENWLKKSPLSNFKQIIGEAKDMTLGNREALSYRSDGLYRNETVVSVNGDFIYVFNVTFNSLEDNIYKDFYTLLATVKL
ncbi:MAG: hypothetical protein AAB534_00810 [Patescibacteria group bacterium]